MDIEKAYRELVKELETSDKEFRLHMSYNDKLKFKMPDEYNSLDGMKPNGLWYGFNTSWIEWCLSEQPDWLRSYLYEIKLDESKILKINNLEEFDNFEKKYFIENPLFINKPKYKTFKDCIDWKEIAHKYDGIEINPYLWERRLNGSFWYYGWDCASGCVWNPKIVTIKLCELPLPKGRGFLLEDRLKNSNKFYFFIKKMNFFCII